MRLTTTALIPLLLLAVPLAAIVTFWTNGGWSQDSTPTWWWILAAVSAALGFVRWSLRRRDAAQAADRAGMIADDAPAALQAWWLIGGTLLYLTWLGLALALVVAGNSLGRIVGAGQISAEANRRVTQMPASRSLASPNSFTCRPIRSMIDRYRPHSFRLSSPALR